MPNYPNFLTVTDASRYSKDVGTPVAIGTLNKLRCVGGSAPFMRFGRKVVYPKAPFHGWLMGRLSPEVTSTSAFAA